MGSWAAAAGAGVAAGARVSRVRAKGGWLRSRLALTSLLVAAFAFVAYARAVGFGFIYDDYWTILSNRHLQRPLRELAAAAWSGQAVAQGIPDATRPLMTWSSWLDWRLAGTAAWAHHLHSLALYALVCVAVYLLCWAVARRVYVALAAALIFAVSPLHAEVVAAVNYREDLIAGLGSIGAAACLFWPRWRTTWGGAIAVAALWLMGLLAKESAFVLPLLVLALALVRRPNNALWFGAPPLGVVLLAVGAAWLSWRWGVSVQGDDIPRASYASVGERLLREARFLVSGTFTALAPVRARPEYGPQAPAGGWWLLGLAGLLGLIALFRLRRNTRVMAGALAFALVAPVFSSPLFAPINERADRYWFVASLGGALLGGSLLQLLARWSAKASYACLGVVLGVGLWASWAAAGTWASESRLWIRAVQGAPDSPRAWASLSRLHRLAGQDELAARAVTRALEHKPGYTPALVTRAYNELAVGDVVRARATLAAVRAGAPEARGVEAAERCARGSAAEATACIQRTAPAGVVIGDPEELRAFAEGVWASEGAEGFQR
jgi:protein O-mannosyl-transferase